MELAIILAVVYAIGLPIILRLAAFAHKKLITDKKIEKMQRNKQSAKKQPTVLWHMWKERLKFAFKDKRMVSKKKPKDGEEPTNGGLKNNQMLFLIWGIGLILAAVAGITGKFILLGIAALTFFISVGFGITTAKSVLEARKNVLARMFEIATTKLGQSAEYKNNPSEVIRVTEWNDFIKPNKVEFDVPTAFNAEGGEEGFMKQFNQIFGQETAWIPSDDPETHEPGWNYEKGMVTIHAVPPLPQMAPWSDHYVNAEGVAWSFFPIGLSTSNGIELPNPETGLVENVIGFDLSGEQAGIGKKAGIKVSPTITTSPMCLVAETLIVMSDDTVKSIKEISEMKSDVFVKSIDENGDFVSRRMFGTQVTRYNAEVLKLTMDDESEVICTLDHKWLTDSGYVPANEIHTGSKIVGYKKDFSTVSSVEKLDELFTVYDGEVEETHNFIVKNDSSSGIVSHNCFVGGGTGGGKSLDSETLVRVVK